MRRTGGFSMVELMVAVTLSLIVTAAVLSVFVASRASYSRTTGTASLADGSRFALDFLQGAVRGAGYIGCGSATSYSSIVSVGSVGSVLGTFATSQALTGFEASGTSGTGGYNVPSTSPTNQIPTDSTLSDWIGGLDVSLKGAVVKNNDVLVIYTSLANEQPVYISATPGAAATSFTVNTLGSLNPNGNQLIAVSDCATSVVMWSSAPITGAAPSFTVTHDTTGGLNSTSILNPNYSFSVGAQVTPVDAAIYYIGQGADGDGALFRNALNGGATPTFPPTELVPDIEAMQILYGVDTTDANQTVTDYVTADKVPLVGFNGWGSVVSVKIAILAASQLNAVQPPTAALVQTYNLLGTIVTPPADSRARHMFEMTIGLRNQSQ